MSNTTNKLLEIFKNHNNECVPRVAVGITLMVLLLVGNVWALSPTVEFTNIPPYGSFNDLQGKVTNVIPTDYKVAVYIYVSGWWTKPTFSDPLTNILGDGTWICDITTGGSDQHATKIRAFIVPNGYTSPQMSGGQILPLELESYPSVETTRQKSNLDILAYYRGLGVYPNIVETTDLLTAANDWRDNIIPTGSSVSIATNQLLTLANEWIVS